MSLTWVIVLMVLPFISGMLTMAAIMTWRAQQRRNNHVRQWFAMPPLHFLPISVGRRNWAKPDGKPDDPDRTGIIIPRSWMPQ